MLQLGKCLVEGIVFVETRLSGAEAMLGGEELGEWAVDLVADDFFVGDEDVFEDGLVELAPNLVTCAHVERMWVFEQFQVGFEELCSVAEVIDHGGKFGSEFVALPFDVCQAGANLALWQGAVRGEARSRSEELHHNGVQVSRMVSRVLDSNLRAAVGAFSSHCAGMTMTPSIYKGLSSEELEDVTFSKMLEMNAQVADVMGALGEAIRQELARA